MIALSLLLAGCHAQEHSGLFHAAQHIAVGRNPIMLLVAEVDGDRKLDLIVSNEGDDRVTVLVGDGRGHFRPAPASPFAAGPHPSDLTVADFNRDGKLDIAVANHTVPQFTLLLGDGKGGFRPAPGSPFTVATRPHSHGVAAGDFNGDGNPDVAIEDWDENKVVVVLGDGKGGFSTPGTTYLVGDHPYQRLRSADMDGDGRADIVTTNWEGNNVTVLLSDGKGFHQATGSPFGCPAAPFAHALADVNGDGRPDVIAAHYSGHSTDTSSDAVSVLLNLGGGRLGPARRYDGGRLPIGVAVGDLNHDGKADLAVADMGGDSVTVLLGDGRGEFRPGGSYAVGRGPEAVAVGDLNGDGKPDLVVADTASNQISLLLAR
jgi:hypothetical protein